jgi:hypothetical protein
MKAEPPLTHRRNVRSGVTGGQMADELAEAILSTFGGVKASDAQHAALSDHLIASAVRWVNDEFKLGIPEGRDGA